MPVPGALLGNDAIQKVGMSNAGNMPDMGSMVDMGNITNMLNASNMEENMPEVNE
jgi:hypothetical protein